jgi:ABC-type transport system involved in multi-copper enzyme maturation permease subunit
MLTVLIKKEIVNNVLSLRFMVTFALFFVLIQLSIFALTDDYRARLRVYEASKSIHRERISELEAIEDSNERLSNLIFEQGVYGDRPPQPLGFFVRGLEDDLPTQVHTSLWMSRRINESYYRNPLFSLFATPDYSYIVNIVVSLLALLFVFDAVCGEKERGTLKLVLAHSVPRDLVLLSKWVGGYISLAVPFLVAVLGGITYVYLTGTIQLTGETLETLLWIVAVSLLYISLFFTLGMFISTVTHKAATSLLVSLFVWVCWILVIPNLAPVIAKILSPVPTLQKVEAEKVAVDREVWLRIERLSRTMLGYGRKAEKMREKLIEEGERRKRKLDQFFQDKLRDQIALSRTLSRLSPSASFTYATTGLAGTGVDLFGRFRQGYERFRSEFREYGEQLNVKRNDDKLPENWFQKDDIPAMKILPARLDDALTTAFTDLLLLAVFNVLFFMGSYLFFLRYDVT